MDRLETSSPGAVRLSDDPSCRKCDAHGELILKALFGGKTDMFDFVQDGLRAGSGRPGFSRWDLDHPPKLPRSGVEYRLKLDGTSLFQIDVDRPAGWLELRPRPE